jgi:hypothetical protein
MYEPPVLSVSRQLKLFSSKRRARQWGQSAVADERYCNPSPIGFPNDKPPSIKFRALLSEGDAELFELART